MKRLVLILILPLLWAAAGSCTPQDQVGSGEEPANFVALLRTKSYTVEEFARALAAQGEGYDFIVPLLARVSGNITIDAHVISYRTVDPWGKPVLSSGVVFFPQSKHIRGVIETTPIAYIQKTSGVSDRLPAVEAVQSCFGYITLMADYLGFGITQDLMPHPYLHLENTGRVAYDMRQAAREFLRTRGYTLPQKTRIAGYSLGASMALAMARYYQLRGENVEVEQLLIGGGCYDLEVAFNAFAQKGVSEYCAVPTIIHAMDQVYHLGLDYSRIFKGPLLENYEDWLDRSDAHSAHFLHAQLGDDLHGFMHPDFFTEAKNPEFDKLYQVARINSHVNGWTPAFPVKLFYATDDLSVPPECSEYLIQAFRRRGADLFVMHGTGGHVGYAIPMFVDFYLYLLLN